MKRFTNVDMNMRNDAVMTGTRSGCFNRRGSRIGCVTPRSRRTSRMSAAAEPIPRRITAGESQPILPPSVRNSTRQASPTAARAAPRRSKRGRTFGLDSASMSRARSIVIRVRGTRARNIERQPNVSTRTPPPSVAEIIPSVEMADIRPSALPRSSDGKMAVISAGADATMRPLPTA